MARIKLPEVSDLTPEENDIYEKFPSNLTRGILTTTKATAGYMILGGSFRASQLEDKDRELVILRVGALSSSAYERMQHYPLALKAGWTEEQIAEIENGVGSDERSSIILRFVDECVADVKVSVGTFAEAAAFYSDVQLAELTLLIGHYMMTARFLETLEIDLDEAPTSWDNAHV